MSCRSGTLAGGMAFFPRLCLAPGFDSVSVSLCIKVPAFNLSLQRERHEGGAQLLLRRGDVVMQVNYRSPFARSRHDRATRAGINA